MKQDTKENIAKVNSILKSDATKTVAEACKTIGISYQTYHRYTRTKKAAKKGIYTHSASNSDAMIGRIVRLAVSLSQNQEQLTQLKDLIS